MQIEILVVGYNLTEEHRKLITNLISHYLPDALTKVEDLNMKSSSKIKSSNSVITFGEVARRIVDTPLLSLPPPSRLIAKEENKELRLKSAEKLSKLDLSNYATKKEETDKREKAEERSKVTPLEKIKPEELISLLKKGEPRDITLEDVMTIKTSNGSEEKGLVLTIEEAVIISLSANLLGAKRVSVEAKDK